MQQRRAVQDRPVETEARLPPPGASAEGCGAPERLLLEAARRAGRSPHGHMVLVLHLSRLPPPGPRPHHRRIARAILDDTAQRHEGQVFALGNGDMVLLCRMALEGRAVAMQAVSGLAVSDPAALSATMAALLRVDLPDPANVATVWLLPETLAAFTAYAAERVAESGLAMVPPAPPGAGLAEQTVVVGAIAAIAEEPAITDVMQRQVGVLVSASDRSGVLASAPLLPLYRELSFSMATLEARLGAADQAAADPFLFRHLACRLDQRMLVELVDAAGTGGPLDITAGRHTAPPLHINLTLSTILSDIFARFAQLCHRFDMTVGVEVALVEVCGDGAAFERARGFLADAGLSLVLGGVSYLMLLLARPCALRPDLVKLDWSPRLPSLPAEDRLQITAELERIGLDRVVLNRAETEVALRWGMAQGVCRFQGRHVDAILAAGRSLACPNAAGCSLRQCMERAAAIGAAGWAGDRSAAPVCSATDMVDSAPVPLPLAPGRPRASAA